jgi:hypothetical protein
MIWKSKLESSSLKEEGDFSFKTTSQRRREFATRTKLHKEPCFGPKFPKKDEP